MVARVMPQALLFPVAEWGRSSAITWLRSNGFKSEKVVKEANHYRARQFDPSGCKSFGTKIWLSRRDAAGRGRWKPKKILAVYCQRSFE
jgi:hypothetical protein